MTRESEVEKYLERRVREAGGRTRKVKWIGRHSAPDRLILLPGFHTFVEVKRPTEKARPAQEREHERLRAAGCRVVVLSTFDEVDRWIIQFLP